MHLLVREEPLARRGRSRREDLGQSPAELLFLSFSDSDLGCAAAAWASMDERGRRCGWRVSRGCAIRCRSISMLDRVASHARGMVVRLLGGLDYWRYGAEEVAALARRRGIALALLPGDGAKDANSRPRHGADTARARLDALFRGRRAGAMSATRCVWRRISPASATIRARRPPPTARIRRSTARIRPAERPIAALVFYRSHLLAADTAPIDALAEALRARGLAVRRAVTPRA